jgi:hypothetical protein
MASRTESQSAPLVVHGSRALALPKASRRYEEVRTCAHEGCTTRLSAYNAYETCYNHTYAWSARKIASAKRTRKSPAASVLAEVSGVEVTTPAGSVTPEFPESSRIAS